jgi:flagellar biosynthesis protein FlhF
MNAAKLEMIQYELREIKDFMKEITQAQDGITLRTTVLPANLRAVYQKLISCEIEEAIVEGIMRSLRERLTEKELNDNHLVDETLAKLIAQRIEVSGALAVGNHKIVAFVGPTGVGKTTTMAKLAANYTLLEKKKVAMITVDTYRIAAVEQLKTYAEIMGIPIEVVFTTKELVPALHKHREKDLILVDTAGRNPLNEGHMDELRKFLDQDSNIDVHLVLSITTKPKEIIETFNRFEVAKVHHIIFTKLDEAASFGNLLSAVAWAKRPVAYITTGQNVPEDIELADSTKLAKLILNQGANPFVKNPEILKK